MADDLVSQLARSLNLPPDAARHTLDHLVATLRERLDADGEAAVPGLGTFRRSDEGLAFHPDAGLARAVNHRYAGLRPIEAGFSSRRSDTVPEEEDPFAAAALEESEPDTEDEQGDEVEEEFDDEPADDLDAPDFQPLDAFIDAEDETDEEDESAADTYGSFDAFETSLDAPNTEPDSEHEGSELGDEAEDLEENAETDFSEHDDEPVWAARPEPSDSEHVLGPPPPDDVEDADFDVISDIEEPDAAESALAPTPEARDEEVEEQADEFAPDEFATDEPAPVGATAEDAIEEDAPSDEADTETDFAPYGGSPDDEETEDEADTETTLPLAATSEDAERHAATHEPEFDEPEFDEPALEDDESVFEEEPASEEIDYDDAHTVEAQSDEPADETTPVAVVPPTSDAVDAPPVASDREAHAPERRRGGAGFVVGTLVLVAVAAGLFWFLSREPAPPIAQSGPPADDTSAVAETPLPSAASPADSAIAAADSGAAEAPAASTEPASPPDPLRGAANVDPAEGGFTWVVASEVDEARAEQRAARYRDQGFRAGVVAEEAAGRTRYRVSLGQFATVEDAEARRADLPADAPPDSWIHDF